MKKHCLIIGIYTAASCLAALIALLFIRFGNNWLVDEDSAYLYYFLPFWTFLCGYVGYGTARYYYQQKEIYFPYNTRITDVQDRERTRLWMMHKKDMYSRLMFLLFKLFGLACPILLLAYLDSSKYIDSNLFVIIATGILSAICFIAGKRLKMN